MKIKMAGATATKFKKNDTAHQLAVAIYIFIQSGIHYETIHMLNNQVMLTSWTSLFNVHNGIKQKKTKKTKTKTDVRYSLLPGQNSVKRT